MKKTLQLKGVTSLRVAVERAKAVKLIHKNSFSHKANIKYFNERKREKIEDNKEKKDRRNNNKLKPKTVRKSVIRGNVGNVVRKIALAPRVRTGRRTGNRV